MILGIGMDIVKTSRIEQSAIRYGDRFAWNNKYYSVTLVEKDFPDRMIALGEAID